MTPDPLRQIVLTYAPPLTRPAFAALLALDDALAQLLRTTSEPALGQLRLAWWRESLARLDSAPPPAEPVLQGLGNEVLPLGISGESLIPIVHGWEVLVEEAQLDAASLMRFAEGRGTLFAVAARLFQVLESSLFVVGGQGWALADLALHLGKPEERAAAQGLALSLLKQASQARWPRQARALGVMVQIARMELDPAWTEAGPLVRTGRLLWHRVTGR